MRDYTEEELKMLSDVLPNIALQLRTSLSTIYTAVDRMAPQETREKDPKTDRTAPAELLPALSRHQQSDRRGEPVRAQAFRALR